MKIDQTHPLTRPAQNEATEQRKGAETVEGAHTAAGSRTTLSQIATADDSSDIDTARVNEIRQAISEGRLELDTGKIADGLVKSVRDMLGER
ncbi:flagellar biosynthesis anti-sigma factor FlgM [Salinicola sp. MH3R3-1]|uniref:flagellar biosynthesis anti-sigma factor FlgM n=1 Tax=Salinicola TaxID=404432 RepID=UPI00094F23D3|nr:MULTISPECIES: flagellar biosynthesis anti-sigma factor FlgM [Salinicola]OLO07994.1 flagellar biosynthesis anti-sigma factor FlgM [Salinicola sp. MH3R3-1]